MERYTGGFLTAVVESPGFAAEGPHAGIQDARVVLFDGDVRAAGILVDVQHLIPRGTSIGGFEYAAFFIRPPLAPEGAYIRHVRIMRIHHDTLDALRLLQPEVRPRLAAIHRPVHAPSIAHAVARIPLARADPQDVVIRGCDGEGSDRIGALVFEDGIERDAAVGRFEDATVCAGYIVCSGIAGNTVDVGDAPAHIGRPDSPPFHVFEGLVRGQILAVALVRGSQHQRE